MAVIDAPYPTLFRTFIEMVLKRSLAQVQACSGPLPEDVRDQALHALSFGLKLATVWPLTRTLLLDLAPRMEQMGHRDDWLPYLEQGITCSQHCADLLTAAELQLQVGYLQRLCNRFAAAQHSLHASAEAFSAMGQLDGQARALNHLAYLAWQQHRYPEAEQLAGQALTLLADGDPEQASSFTTLGELARVRQQWQAAEQYHQMALQIRRQQGDPRRTAWSLQNLGNTLRSQGRFTETITHYRQAMTLLAEIHDHFHWAIICMNVAILYYQGQQFQQALDHYTQAEAIFRQVQSTLYLAKIAVNKGLVFLALQDWPQAENAFITSAELFQSLNDVGEALNARDGLGLTYLYQGKRAAALTVFTEALQALSQLRNDAAYATLQRELAEHWAQAQQRETEN